MAEYRIGDKIKFTNTDGDCIDDEMIGEVFTIVDRYKNYFITKIPKGTLGFKDSSAPSCRLFDKREEGERYWLVENDGFNYEHARIRNTKLARKLNRDHTVSEDGLWLNIR